MKLSWQRIYRFLGMLCMIALVCALSAGCKKGPKAVETVTGEDGSKWEQVSEPGFGNKNNGSIVSMCEFKDSIYAVTRNDVSGFELWRTKGRRWEQVEVPGFTDADGIFHDLMNNVWSDIIVFKDHLYVVVSSGYQGSKLFKSVGFEMWRYDGEKIWEPIISHATGTSVEGAISAIDSCAAGDGSLTAAFTASSAAWTADQFKDGILWITSGAGRGRAFDIIGNTATTLTVQQNEVAASAEAGIPEYTVCAEQTFTTDTPFPPYTIGAIAVGDSFKIIKGVSVNGFGQLWNKGIVDLEIYKDELYASVGFNYEKGARVWKSTDGAVWAPSSQYSMGMRHGYDADNNSTGICLIDGQEYRNGSPVSSSLPKFGKFTVGGDEILIIGGTGTSGCNGRGLRIFRLYADGWKAIVDYFVDTNTTGTNENGIGDDGSSSTGFDAANFQAWSWAVYDDVLFTGISRFMGGRIMYTPNAAPEDGSWVYAVGGGSSEQDGFGYKPNICFNISTYDTNKLIAGSIEEETFAKLADSANIIPAERGADIWWAQGSKDALTWTQVTKDAFGDQTIVQFESPREFFGGDFYIAASSFGPSTPFPTTPDYGAREGYTGAKVYRLKSKLK
ncbi:MAG: hypothetical protein NTX06_06400 [Proteobacteria bacterium]|nr:hypothetical protein [Pseudomonadota bacterium]